MGETEVAAEGWDRSVGTNRFPVRRGRKSQPEFKRRQGVGRARNNKRQQLEKITEGT